MTDQPKPDEVERQTTPAQLTARELVLLLPNFAKLLWRLAKDGRVPLRVKLLAVATGCCLAMPFDLIPDWLPGIGYLDDAFLIGFVIWRLIRAVPAPVLEEHWDGTVPLTTLAQKISFRRGPPKGGDGQAGASTLSPPG